jgi:hypothetical protein
VLCSQIIKIGKIYLPFGRLTWLLYRSALALVVSIDRSVPSHQANLSELRSVAATTVKGG